MLNHISGKGMNPKNNKIQNQQGQVVKTETMSSQNFITELAMQRWNGIIKLIDSMTTTRRTV